MEEVLKELNIPFKIQAGEGAFYGPKLDLCFVDAMENDPGSWELFSVTLICRGLFGLKYTAQDNTDRVPVLLHRAILGFFGAFHGSVFGTYSRSSAFVAGTPAGCVAQCFKGTGKLCQGPGAKNEKCRN